MNYLLLISVFIVVYRICMRLQLTETIYITWFGIRFALFTNTIFFLMAIMYILWKLNIS